MNLFSNIIKHKINKKNPLKILMVASEVFPYVKTGGLADAVAALSTTLASRGHDVRILLPRYFFIDKSLMEKKAHTHLTIKTARGLTQIEIFRAYPFAAHSAKVYLVEAEGFFAHRHVYGDVYEPLGKGNGHRYGVLCMSALSFCKKIHWTPDVIHCHDWHTAPLLPMIEMGYAPNFMKAVRILTIHNGGYQGIFSLAEIMNLGISEEQLARYHFIQNPTGTSSASSASPNSADSADSSQSPPHPQINYLRAGIRHADGITTVSKQYAHDILDSEFSKELCEDLQERQGVLHGILNGLDYTIWDPSCDHYLPVKFDMDNMAPRAEIKKIIQERAGFQTDPNIPIICMISRLVDQKGFIQLCMHHAIPQMLQKLRCQYIVLGCGQIAYEKSLADFATQYPHFAFWNWFCEDDAHLLAGGADFLLMPSLYEPCGLSQMYALRYGTIPIVSETGGLRDTISPYDFSIPSPAKNGHPDGFFISDITADGIYRTVAAVLELWDTAPETIKKMQRAGMEKRFNWDWTARRYEELYQNLGRRRTNA